MFRLQVFDLFTVFLVVTSVKCSNEVLDSNESPSVAVNNLNGAITHEKPLITVPGVIHPFIRHIRNESHTENSSPKLIIKHEAGARINGDRLLIRYTGPKQMSEIPFDVKQTELFEFEAIITYIQVEVEQTTNESQVHALSGGIGHKYIVVGTIAEGVLYFGHVTKIYGYFV